MSLGQVGSPSRPETRVERRWEAGIARIRIIHHLNILEGKDTGIAELTAVAKSFFRIFGSGFGRAEIGANQDIPTLYARQRRVMDSQLPHEITLCTNDRLEFRELQSRQLAALLRVSLRNNHLHTYH